MRLKKILDCPDYRPLGYIPKWKSIAYFQAYTLLKEIGGIGYFTRCRRVSVGGHGNITGPNAHRNCQIEE